MWISLRSAHMSPAHIRELRLSITSAVAIGINLALGKGSPRSFLGFPLVFKAGARAVAAINLVELAIFLVDDQRFAAVAAVAVPRKMDGCPIQRIMWCPVLADDIRVVFENLNVFVHET